MESDLYVFFFSSVTLVCKHSHVFKNVCQGRLLLQKGNNSSLIQKQYIRGLPRHKDTAELQIQKGWPFLAKHLLITATVRLRHIFHELWFYIYYDVFFIVKHCLRGDRIHTLVGIKACLTTNCSVTFYGRCSLISDMRL